MKNIKRISKYFEIPRADVELSCVAAFYKQDLPGGIGVIIPKYNLNLIFNIVLDSLDGWEKEWQAATTEKDRQYLYDYAIGQLEEWGKLDPKKAEQERVLAIANIAFLERHEKLESDNYNGMLLQWSWST